MLTINDVATNRAVKIAFKLYLPARKETYPMGKKKADAPVVKGKPTHA